MCMSRDWNTFILMCVPAMRIGRFVGVLPASILPLDTERREKWRGDCRRVRQRFVAPPYTSNAFQMARGTPKMPVRRSPDTPRVGAPAEQLAFRPAETRGVKRLPAVARTAKICLQVCSVQYFSALSCCEFEAPPPVTSVVKAPELHRQLLHHV